MKIKIKRVNKAPSEKSIARAESELGCALPVEYLVFLAKYNGGEPETNIFRIPGTANESGVNEFIAIENLAKEFELGGFRQIGGVIPIAYAEGGNYVCLSTAKPDLGAVLFWDHEVVTDRSGLLKLANSVQEFLDLLEPFDPRQVKLKPGQVKSAWIDPSLLDDSK